MSGVIILRPTNTCAKGNSIDLWYTSDIKNDCSYHTHDVIFSGVYKPCFCRGVCFEGGKICFRGDSTIFSLVNYYSTCSNLIILPGVVLEKTRRDSNSFLWYHSNKSRIG